MTDYAASGVDLEQATSAKTRIAAAARSTFTKYVLTDVGLFGGCFALGEETNSDVLVASTDGVGTKLLLGVQLGLIDQLGRDLVHHCINDILMCGARPLFMLDYLAFGKLDADVAATVAESLAAACREHGVALIGGETAEMPGLYEPGHFDLAGTIVGIVQRNRIVDGKQVRLGDTLIGIASDGLHTNGFSLARRVLADEIRSGAVNTTVLSDGQSLAHALMKPHRCYLKPLGSQLDHYGLHAMSHITGGGIEDNTQRVLAPGLRLNIDWSSWKVPPLFEFIQSQGQITIDEMRRVFNLGVGAIAIVSPESADDITARLIDLGEHAWIMGSIEA
jgi:phosphoribosylformylglycinamidine cyclo-ligase